MVQVGVVYENQNNQISGYSIRFRASTIESKNDYQLRKLAKEKLEKENIKNVDIKELLF